MKTRFQVRTLTEALDLAAIVSPRAATPDGIAGFLFVVSGDQCSIYSREQRHQIRVTVPIESAEGDGSFIFPADRVSALKYLDGWIEIESGKDADGDRHWVRYEAESRDKQEDLSTVDPRMMQGLDDAYNAATEGTSFPAALLREAIATTRPYLAKVGDSRVEEHFQTLQVFDDSREDWKRGNGYMFAADGIRTCYFYCERFQGKHLALHGLNLPVLSAFLSKCPGDVTLRLGKSMTFLVNKNGQVLGWAHNTHTHGKFSYYGHKADGFVLRSDKDLFVKALRYIRAALDSKRDKVRLEYSHTNKMLSVLASEGIAKAASRPIPVEVVEEENGAGVKGEHEDFAVNLNLNHLIDLIDPMKGHRVELRVALTPATKDRKEGGALLRTVDAFILDEDGKMLISKGDAAEGKAAECQVTRFMPSRE